MAAHNYGKRIKFGAAVLSLTVLICYHVYDAAAQTSSVYTTGDIEQMSADIGKKVDTAIKVLRVLQQEMEAISAQEKAVQPSISRSTVQQAPATIGEQVKEKTSLIIRIWRKLRELLRKEGYMQPKQGAVQEMDDEELARTVEQSVDTIVSISQKVQKIVAAYSTAAAQYTTTGIQGQENWSESVKSKLDSTIKVLDSVRKEMDEGDQSGK